MGKQSIQIMIIDEAKRRQNTKEIRPYLIDIPFPKGISIDCDLCSHFASFTFVTFVEQQMPRQRSIIFDP